MKRMKKIPRYSFLTPIVSTIPSWQMYLLLPFAGIAFTLARRVLPFFFLSFLHRSRELRKGRIFIILSIFQIMMILVKIASHFQSSLTDKDMHTHTLGDGRLGLAWILDGCLSPQMAGKRPRHQPRMEIHEGDLFCQNLNLEPGNGFGYSTREQIPKVFACFSNFEALRHSDTRVALEINSNDAEENLFCSTECMTRSQNANTITTFWTRQQMWNTRVNAMHFSFNFPPKLPNVLSVLGKPQNDQISYGLS